MGEYYQEQREQIQIKKAKQLKSNLEIVLFLAGELNFKVVKHSDVHFSLYTKGKTRMDYWPSTSRGLWYKNKKPNGSSFHIFDTEQYILRHFK